MLGHWPDTRVILIAYSDDLAIRSGALVRDIFMKWGPEFFGQTVDANYESKQEWRLAGHQGGMLSVGIGSRISGMPGDLVVLGDLIKGMEEAGSTKTKETHWAEFHGAILPRLQPGGTMLLGATRFADDDMSGRIDAQAKDPEYDGDRWESLVFKAIAEPDFDEENPDDPEWRDLLGRKRGEPLKTRFSKPGEEEDPERWHDSFFYRRKRTTVPFIFSVVYEQEPTSPTGGMFPPDKWAWYDPDDKPWMQSRRRAWDLAASEGGGDYSVGGLVTKDVDDVFYVQDITRFQKGANEVMDEVKVTAFTDGVSVPVLIEGSRNGDGLAVIAFYKRELKNYTVTMARAEGSKEERARPYSTLMQQGRVKLPRGKDGKSPDWVAPFIDEHRKMMGDGRKGRYDDQCLVGETAVTTPTGEVRLDQVRSGQFVLGASGWTRVLWAGCTGVADVVGVGDLVGTRNHPVWAMSGWVNLGDLGRHDDIVSIWSTERRFLAQSKIARPSPRAAEVFATSTWPECAATATPWSPSRPSEAPSRSTRSSSRESSSVDIQTRAHPHIATTTNPAANTSSEVFRRYIKRCGSQSTGQSRKDGRSTTLTATLPTTTPPTWRLSPAVITNENTQRAVAYEREAHNSWPFLTASDRLLPRGIAHPKEWNGTERTAKRCGVSDDVAVYNLTTEDGTYFANGILVHNCDVVAHAINDMLDSNVVEMLIPDLHLRGRGSRASVVLGDSNDVMSADEPADVIH